jgi:hypothetical protein
MPTPMMSSASEPAEGPIKSRYAFWMGERSLHAATADVEKNLPVAPKDVHSRSGFQRLTSPFRAASLERGRHEVELPMNVLESHGATTVRSTVAAGPPSPKSRVAAEQRGVLVSRDIRQGSEVAVNDW